ncbi:helix-turn-helix transcriptional regulator [Haloechinothrix salitolerans]|uniref:Helix-turn-helix domain-containing protein n=1 Tax=Haloechinothrix salitolerans TaxID=926830 RepID=A0ABW2BYN3_9PSEU
MKKSRHTADYQRMCRLLAQLRDEAGLTQAQVANQLGVPQSFVSKYESGTRRLDIVELRRIIDVLGVMPGTFLHQLDPSWLQSE